MIILNKWFESQGIELLKKIGLKSSDKVLDCFCGEGNYSIPASSVVGRCGTVYTLDRDSLKLSKLRKQINKKDIQNIEISEKDFDDKLDFPDSFFDVVLLFDVFWYYPPGDDLLISLLKELNRVIKEDGILSVYPEHIDINELIPDIISMKFVKGKGFNTDLIHDNDKKRGYILNFTKV